MSRKTLQQQNEEARTRSSLANELSSADTDEKKYQAAAHQVLSRGENLDRNALKKAIDQEYGTLNPTKSGREMRGETAWSDFVEGVNNVRHGINTGIGNGIDWLWDNTAGNLAGALGGEKSEKAVKDFMTGEDLSVIPDIASDVLLTIPGWTIPLVVAKEAFRNADNMNEALTGKDSITLEQLDDDQRRAKAAMSALGIGLSAVPGVGKVKSIAKLASKDAAKEAAEQAAKESKTIFDSAQKSLVGSGSDFDKAIDDLLKKSTRGYSGEFMAAPGVSSKEFEAAQKAVTEAAKAGRPILDELKAAQDAAKKAQDFANASTAGRIGQLFKNDMSGFAEGIKNITGESGSWATSRNRIAAEKELKKKMREANTLLDKKSTAADRRAALEAAMPEIRTAEGELDKDAMSKALDDLLEKAGYSFKDEAGKFKPGLPKIMPQFIRSAGDVARDVGVRSNRSLIDSQKETYGKSIEELLKLAETAESGTELEKALARIGLNAKQNPTGAASTFKSTLLGPATSMPLIPLAYQAEYGGGYADNMNRIAEDIDANGIGRYLAATFPIGGQRMLAQSALPGLTGKLGAYHPYGAIRAANTIGDANEYAEVPAMQHRFNEALKNNSKKAGN